MFEPAFESSGDDPSDKRKAHPLSIRGGAAYDISMGSNLVPPQFSSPPRFRAPARYWSDFQTMVENNSLLIPLLSASLGTFLLGAGFAHEWFAWGAERQGSVALPSNSTLLGSASPRVANGFPRSGLSLAAYVPQGGSLFEAATAAPDSQASARIRALCEKVDETYRHLKWGTSPCQELPWRFSRSSEKGEPLVYLEFDSREPQPPEAHRDETTLVLGGVHPDEVTPIHLAFQFARELFHHPEIYRNRRVVVAPLVNPDGFFQRPFRRTNSQGVDLNRNFPTRDWWKKATLQWKNRKGGDPRHFPGKEPRSEEGTLFQMDLVAVFDPDKIISVHAPLGFLDYDGPGDLKSTNLHENERRARKLASVISQSVNNYRIRDYSFYPGSLGNYTGNERSVPTITLELASTDPQKSSRYWKDFAPGLKAAVSYDFVKDAAGESALSNLNGLESQPR